LDRDQRLTDTFEDLKVEDAIARVYLDIRPHRGGPTVA
jgi:hypothetical protein